MKYAQGWKQPTKPSFVNAFELALILGAMALLACVGAIR